jgi:hypothetical protein
MRRIQVHGECVGRDVGRDSATERAIPISGVIAADLAVMPALDLMTWLGNRQQSGVLRFERSAVTRRATIVAGRVARVRSSRASEGLAQFIRNSGLGWAAALEQAQHDADAAGTRLGFALVSAHGVAAAELGRVLEHQIRELILDAVRWTVGRMVFVADELDDARPEVEVAISLLDFRGLAAERAHAWSTFAATFADLEAPWHLEEGALPRDPDPVRDAIVSMLRARESLATILRRLPLTTFEIYAQLYGLVRLGALSQPSEDVDPIAISPADIILARSDATPHSGVPASLAAEPARLAADRGWTPRPTAPLDAAVSACRSPLERQVMRCLDGRRSLRDLKAVTSLPEDVLIRVIIDLAERGLVHM